MRGRAAKVAVVGLATWTFSSLSHPSSASDWPFWRGPQRTGISSESFSGKGRQTWRARVGEGYSAVTVAAGRLYTAGAEGNQDVIYCLDARTGKGIWTYRVDRGPRNFPADPTANGASATPVVDAGGVFYLTREGTAICVDAQTGKQRWRSDLVRASGGQLPDWGHAGSALVDGNRIYFNVSSHGVCVDRASGKVIWKSPGGKAGYATPVIGSVGGKRQLIVFAAKECVGVDPDRGTAVWRHPWQTSYDVNAADPIVTPEGTVFISSNYGRGCALLRISGRQVSVVWENRSMRNHFNPSVLLNGFLYGNDENNLRCLDLRSGAEKWRKSGMGKAGLILAGSSLVAMTERGELFTCRAQPNGYQEIGRVKVMSGTCWTQPVLANGMVYCRNSAGELVAWSAGG